MRQLHVIFHGRVQGVGFRATVIEHAHDLGVVGSVRNTSDGSVEMVAQGLQDQLDKLLLAIEQDPGLARVDTIEKRYSDVESPHTHFKIVS
jgi:acylphosphatase